jgi:glycosyltransferase involved in cell wall biosynthesis
MKHVVTIDARTFGATGLGRYVSDLLENFASIDHEFRFRVLCRDPRKMTELPSEKFEFIQATASIYSLKEQREIARLARGRDLLHCPHYNIPYFYRGRLVVTIHDLTHLTHREFLPNRLAYYYAKFMLRAAAHHAVRIVTVSEFSKRSICESLNIPEEKVHVIHNALSERFRCARPADSSCLQKFRIRKPYLLFVGLLKPHKNVQGLLRAFAVLPAQLRDSHQLVIIGKLDSYYPALRKIVEELSLEKDVLFTGQVSDEELHAIYVGATVFVLPSLNEGFGFPVLEAMACGIPVIASDNSAMPEVVGDAGILVDPKDYRSIARGIEAMLTDAALREKFSLIGKQRAQLFSRREFALRHLEVYRQVFYGH